MPETATAEPPIATPSAPPRSYRRVGAVVALLLVGGVVGAGLSWSLRDSHSAKPEHLVGTVDWSNQSTNLISFREDGRPATGEQVFYQVVSGNPDYPACLVAPSADPVRQDSRRVSLDVVHVTFGGKQPINVALSVTCEN